MQGYFCAVFAKHNVLLSSITQYRYEYTRKQLQLSKDQIYDKMKILIKAFTVLSNLFGNTVQHKNIKELMYIQAQPDEHRPSATEALFKTHQI